MSGQNWLAVLGAAAGSLGSIITAFSLNKVIRELNIARQGIELMVTQIAESPNDVLIFKGFDQRYDRAVSKSNKFVWLGVFLLVAGFVLQAVSVCM